MDFGGGGKGLLLDSLAEDVPLKKFLTVSPIEPSLPTLLNIHPNKLTTAFSGVKTRLIAPPTNLPKDSPAEVALSICSLVAFTGFRRFLNHSNTVEIAPLTTSHAAPNNGVD